MREPAGRRRVWVRALVVMCLGVLALVVGYVVVVSDAVGREQSIRSSITIEENHEVDQHQIEMVVASLLIQTLRTAAPVGDTVVVVNQNGGWSAESSSGGYGGAVGVLSGWRMDPAAIILLAGGGLVVGALFMLAASNARMRSKFDGIPREQGD